MNEDERIERTIDLVMRRITRNLFLGFVALTIAKGLIALILVLILWAPLAWLV